jgi:predicted ester cyclase
VPDPELDAHYRRYLTCLNERRFDRLIEFVHDEITYNDAPMSRADYRDLIARHVAAVPDMFFAIDLLVVRDDHVACRIIFDCTPQDEFLGRQPTGRKVSFSEHVFYRFREGRIANVWSLLDMDAIRTQLPGCFSGADAGPIDRSS